ncbi:DUF1566 domain-containing protein [Paracrocinitomix mangrovi]|uniref:Lcl domain-containing protein n=1 Tax=Paracrocinitomix mangrovi TaxID=2862509 RepID=UPI001C8DDFDB|nr:DUF1566 domain-containing protein [Paracrocinitomix mangrovi]UKN02038.1 DUF1566 domain-containing protein [Paracrocinitomix mangrovi]
MVVCPEDLDTDAWWCSSGNNVSGASDASIGAGLTNTNEILTGCGEPLSAAKICDDATIGGYSDWYLPSEDELKAVYFKVHQKGQGNFASNFYWTSTKTNSTTAQHVRFDNGTAGFSTMTNAHYVRGVRNF